MPTRKTTQKKKTETKTAKPVKKIVKEEPKNHGLMLGTDIPRTKTKVSIVGFAPTSMTDVKYVWDDPEMEVWGLNQLYIAFPQVVEKATRWFQIHSRNSYDINVARDIGHHEWLTLQKDFPIYMQEVNDDVPMSYRFPREEIMNVFGTYFTNSISWEIAVACYETMIARQNGQKGFEEMHIYGVDMAQTSEYEFERPSVEYFIGIARGMGIKTVVSEKSDLLKTMYIYPFDDSAPFRTKINVRMQELRTRAQQAGMAEQQAHDSRLQLLGALDNMNYIKQSWENTARELAIEKVKDLEEKKK